MYSIQKRIYQARKPGEKRKVEKLQKLLMKSRSARLLAVRRVTQDNQGKKTAGIDGVKSVKPKERFDLAESIHPKYWKNSKSQPVRRVWIPKPGKPDERRPLGIPVMYERARACTRQTGPRTSLGSYLRAKQLWMRDQDEPVKMLSERSCLRIKSKPK